MMVQKGKGKNSQSDPQTQEAISADTVSSAADLKNSAPEKSAPTAAKAESPVAKRQTRLSVLKRVTFSPRMLFGIVALLLLMLLIGSGWIFWQQYHQQLQLSQQVNRFQQQLALSTQQQADAIAQAQQAAESLVAAEIQPQKSQLAMVTKNEQQLQRHIERLEARLTLLDMRSPDDWLLYEANYLVQLAGFKLFLEHDLVSAEALLRSADERLVQLARPELVPLRAALAKDIAQINAIPVVDTSGVILAINGISELIDSLQIQAAVLQPDSETDDIALTDSVTDWQDNLYKSWLAFSDDFFTVKKRHAIIEPLLTPNESWFLQQNIKTMLLQAQLAVYRSQPTLYQQALKKTADWLQAYFVTDPRYDRVLAELKRLQVVALVAELPEKLRSPALLKRAIKQLSTQTGSAAKQDRGDNATAEQQHLEVKP